jgi:hypothetical protein
MLLSQRHRNKEARRPRAGWANVRAACSCRRIFHGMVDPFSAAGIARQNAIGAEATKADSPIGGIENPSPPGDRQTSKPEEVAISLRPEINY